MNMQVRFYYYLDTIQLIALGLGLFHKRYKEIHYFNISFFAKFLLNLFGFNKHIQLFEFSFSEIKDNDGKFCWPKIYGEDLIEICNIIEKQFLNEDAFIEGLGKIFDKGKIIFFYRKLIAKNMEETLIFMNVIAQYRRKIEQKQPCFIEFVIADKIFFSVLKEFALNEYNITLYSFFSFKKLWDYFTLLYRNLYQLVADCIRSIRNLLLSNKGSMPKKKRGALLAAHLYTLKGFVFNFLERCDFPWLLVSDIPGENIMIYFEREDVPATDEMVNEAKHRNINYLAMSKGASASKEVPVYKPTIRIAKIIFTLLSRIISLLCNKFFSLRFSSLVYLPETLHFIKTYARAYDFYSSYCIKININIIDINPYFIARYLALKDVGGVSIRYQISNWPFSDIELAGSCADIMFLFGPYYYSKFLKSGSCTDNVVISGYISDYAFQNVRERSKRMRNRLQEEGAQFIISYFDENSASGRMSLIPHSRNAYIYKRLLKWAISDQNIGLICSPKIPKRLLKTLPEISKLLQKAKETGRCLFMEGKYLTSNYPSQVAQASDVVITLLAGGTTALESCLSGARVVYLDLEKLYSFPEYNNGRGRIVFDNFDSLFTAIQKYRENPENVPGFGNISEFVKHKDPFKDGNAALRVSQYIGWLFEKFKDGERRDKAIQYANSNYSKTWGEGNIYSQDGNMQMPEIEQTCLVS